MSDLDFIEFDPGTVELGWRFDDVMPEDAVAAMSDFAFEHDYRTLFFSPRRTVSIGRYRIAATSVPWDTLFDCEDYSETTSIADACRRFEARMAKHGWRLPTEDEFEFAAGGGLFWWGDEIPDGIPYGKGTSFTKHKDKTQRGLRLNDDPYNVEVVSNALKTGDGGVSICGGNDWPIAWLALSPSYRAPESLVDGCLPEYLETALVRPVILEDVG